MSNETTEVRDIFLEGLVRGGAEHSDSLETVSKRRPDDTVGNRMVSSGAAVPPRLRSLLLAMTVVGSTIVPKVARSRPASPPSADRYVSAQAYHHALRAELALARSDWSKAHEELQLALVYDPSSVHLHDKLVHLALSQGDLTRAQKYVVRAQRLVPERLEVLRMVAAVSRAQGRLAEAERVLRRVRRRSPNDLDAGLALAEVFVARGRRSAGFALLRKVAAQHPDSPRPLVTRGLLLRADGRWSAAATALSDAQTRGPISYEAASAAADGYGRVGRLARAEAVWTRYLARHPGGSKARLSAARVALARGRVDTAKRWLAEARARDPNAATASVYLEEGYDALAIATFNADRSRTASDLDHQFGLGRALARSGQSDAALGHLGRISVASRHYVEARRLMARILRRRGEQQRAELALEVALEARPRASALIAAFVRALAANGRGEVALQTIRRSRAMALVDTALWSAELSVLDRLGRPSDADSLVAEAGRTLSGAQYRRLAAQRAIRVGSTRARTLSIRRWLAAAPDDVDALLAAIEWVPARARAARRRAARVLAVSPHDPRAVAAFGWFVFREGDQDRGLEHLRRAVRLDPWSVTGAERLGDAAAEQGLSDEANRAYALAIRAAEAEVRSGRRSTGPLDRLRRKKDAMRQNR